MPATELIIRPFEKNDYAAYCALIAQMDALEHALLPHIVVHPEESVLAKDIYDRNYARADVLFVGAFLQEQLVGLIRVLLTMHEHQRRWHARVGALIEEIVVAQDARRQGIATMLLDAAKAWAHSNGAQSLDLNVYDANADAIALYEAYGFNALRTEYRLPLKG